MNLNDGYVKLTKCNSVYWRIIVCRLHFHAQLCAQHVGWYHRRVYPAGGSYQVMCLCMGSYQIRKMVGNACAGNAGNVFTTPRVSDPDMHHGTCVTHVPWCMLGSLTRGFLWSRWRGKRSRFSRRMRNPQFYVSGKRPMAGICISWN